jgi:outer membrane protein assembly factor BamB
VYGAALTAGEVQWRYLTGSSVYSSPVIGSDGTVYVGSHDSYLYAITSSGTLKWRYLIGNSINSSPAIGSDGTVYVGSYDYYLYAITTQSTPTNYPSIQPSRGIYCYE